MQRSGADDTFAIIKAARPAASDARSHDVIPPSGIAREWAALQLIDQRSRDTAHEPRAIAGDPETGVMVIADLGAGATTLVAPLLGSDIPTAERALVDLAKALGELHATTTDCTAEFARLVGGDHPKTGSGAAPSSAGFRRCVEILLARLGGEVPSSELETLVSRWDAPIGWTVLVHGDPCPDNALRVSGDRVELVDFEFAEPGHALRDVAWWHLGFPSCWCAGAVPETLVARADTAYRRAVSISMPVAEDDDVWTDELARVCTLQALISASRLVDGALGDDEPWGTARCRERLLHWLRTCIGKLDARNLLPDFRRVIRVWIATVEGIDAGRGELGAYPAFAPRTVSARAASPLAMAIVVRAGLVLLQRRWRRGRGFVHEFPGGHAEPGESARQTAARELVEETGLVESTVAHESLAVSRDGGAIAFVVFDSCSMQEPVRTEQTRHQHFLWLTPLDVPVQEFAPADAGFVRLTLPSVVERLSGERSSAADANDP